MVREKGKINGGGTLEREGRNVRVERGKGKIRSRVIEERTH